MIDRQCEIDMDAKALKSRLDRIKYRKDKYGLDNWNLDFEKRR